MEKDLVSCIIPTYKRADMLPRAIDSVLNQSYKKIEILVIDDNEPGSPESISVKALLDKMYSEEPRVKYVTQEKHINGAVARNIGIMQSDAEFIAFLDDDEEWHKNKAEIQVDFLRQNPSIDGVSCLYIDYKEGKETRRLSPYTSDDLQLKVLTNRVMIHTSTFLCRREKLIESGGFDPHLLRHQDLQLFVDFLEVGRIEPICQYLVNNHVDSEINRPNYEKLILTKKAFFESVNDIIQKYDKRTQKRIRRAHYYGIAVSAYRSKQYGNMIMWLLKTGFSPVSLKDLIARKKSFIYVK